MSIASVRDKRASLLGGARLAAVASPGALPFNVLRFTGNGADTQTVTIGSKVYELDRAANGVATSGAIAVTAQSDDTPAEVTDALVDAINANQGDEVTALGVSDTVVIVALKRPQASALACSETLTNAAWDRTRMAGGSGPGAFRQALIERVPLAAEVTAGLMYFIFPFAVKQATVSVYTTTTGASIAWDGAKVVDADSGLVSVNNAGDVDWATTSTVVVHAIG